MLLITKKQMEALQADRYRQICTKIVTELRAEYPGQCADFTDDALFEAVSESVKVARAYDLSAYRDLRAFTVLTILTGGRFDHYPKAHDILTDADVPVRRRMQLLFREMKASDWTNVEQGARDDLL